MEIEKTGFYLIDRLTPVELSEVASRVIVALQYIHSSQITALLICEVQAYIWNLNKT